MYDIESIDYYRSREKQARAYAAAATTPSIAEIHLAMADRYADLVDRTETLAKRTVVPMPSTRA